jgi:hypothetical protein
MFSRTMLANLLSRSLTVSMCILFAVLAAAFLSGGPANSHEAAHASAQVAGPR